MGKYEHIVGNITGYIHTIRHDNPIKASKTALVFSARRIPEVGKGLDAQIYANAGLWELLEQRKKIGIIKVGNAAATDSFVFGINCLIHVVVPRYLDGHLDEELLLEECYTNALLKAKERGCKYVYFPVLGSGLANFSKERAREIADRAINKYLRQDGSMNVYLCLYDDIPRAYMNRSRTIVEKSYSQNIDAEIEGYNKYFNTIPIEPEETDFLDILEEAKQLKESRQKVNVAVLIDEEKYDKAFEKVFGHFGEKLIPPERVTIALKQLQNDLGFKNQIDFKNYLNANSLADPKTTRDLFKNDTNNGKTRPKLLAYSIAMRLTRQQINFLLKARDVNDYFPKTESDKIIIDLLDKNRAQDLEDGELIKKIDRELKEYGFPVLVSNKKSLEA